MVRGLTTALLMGSSALALPFVDIHERQNTTDCAVQDTYPAVDYAQLPDPFTFSDGTKVATKADWACRQAEISKLLQHTMSVKVTVGSKSVTINTAIKKPSTSPGPAIITIGGSSLPVPATVGTVAFGNDAFAAQASGSSRGQGDFYTLFGNTHSAGALTAWAWGVDRVVDGLVQLGAATTGIDPERLGTTGCSRNGKGALIAGALVDRIALTLPQESGSGGAACWRISDAQHDAGANIQTAGEIVGENVWFSTNLDAYATKTTTMPEDHHMLAALTAPRGLFVIENDIDWLGPVSTTGCMKAGRLIYQGAGVPTNMGFSLVGGHGHCQFPSAQQTDLTTYINYFLLDGATPPGVVEVSSADVDMADWAPWMVPTLI
ncbi:Uu.00g024760.m01.CDS01 [Anthostomella pinea]|uniref:(4-O-methyl)-D-glucuronate--lignin esterase n=1 Tax=Anthostomella pinea TaxID=933095 RepID=A0AAI8YCK2_9PEZI|nr:Uu.00g024760.m01.CDS01 [Anthostomella pinea]